MPLTDLSRIQPRNTLEPNSKEDIIQEEEGDARRSHGGPAVLWISRLLGVIDADRDNEVAKALTGCGVPAKQ